MFYQSDQQNITNTTTPATTVNSTETPTDANNNSLENKRDRHLRVMTERLAKIEHDFTDAKMQLYKDKLDALKREMKEIQDGTHPEFVKRLKLLENEREQLVKKAQLWKGYQLEITQSLFRTEIEQAEQEYAAEKDGMKDKILQQIEERRRKIREEREALAIDNDNGASGSRAPSRKLRAKRPQMDTFESRSKKKAQQQNPVLNVSLKEQEIMEDFMVFSKFLTKKVGKRRGGNKFY